MQSNSPNRTDGAALLEIADVRVAFGGNQALDGASFSVAGGRTTGLIGPNGAGKTTLFNCISGLLPYGGRVRFDGTGITGRDPRRISRAGLIRTFQLARGFPQMTVFEHLMLYGPDQAGERLLPGLISGSAVRRQEAALREQAFAIAKRLHLGQVLDNRVTALSGGQRKLLEIGRALMAAPKLILLDEPMAGVNPTVVGQIAEHLAEIRDQGIAILLIEHEMELIETLCDDVVVMVAGKFLTRGPFQQVVSDRRVQASYLGLTRA
jgi:branched-chain amino acid transport system ATP-binding protein